MRPMVTGCNTKPTSMYFYWFKGLRDLGFGMRDSGYGMATVNISTRRHLSVEKIVTRVTLAFGYIRLREARKKKSRRSTWRKKRDFPRLI